MRPAADIIESLLSFVGINESAYDEHYERIKEVEAEAREFVHRNKFVAPELHNREVSQALADASARGSGPWSRDSGCSCGASGGMDGHALTCNLNRVSYD